MATIHGQNRKGAKSSEYGTWDAMWQRCTNPKHQHYRRYKQLGVSVCPEWKSFEIFFKDMGLKPSPLHTIDRIDNTKGYYKGNCRWATKKEQGRNKENTHFVEYNGQRKSLVEWSEITGILLITLYYRILVGKWHTERAFTEPVRGKYPNLVK